MLAEHRGELDADLLRYYGIHLTDVLAGRYGMWRVAAWVDHLPPDSALARSDDRAGGWRVTDHLLADVADQLIIANWQRANAGAKSRSKKPSLTWRPGQERTPKETSAIEFAKSLTSADLAAWRERTRR